MIVAALAYLAAAGRDIGLVADQIMNTLANSYLLVAIPMFLLAANVMNAGSISDRLFALCHLAVGRVRGGLAQVDVLVSVLFASMSGSAVADAAGPGLVTIRAMEKAGYPRGFAAAIVAASAVLGPIIPPSIPLLLYALIANASVAALFLGGVVPGLLLAAVMMLVVALTARRRGFPVTELPPRPERPRILARAALPLGMPVLLLGGIYSGAFTPTEAAGVAALYALVLAGILYRELRWRAVYEVFFVTARQTSVILLMLCGAFALNYAVTSEQADKALAAWIDGLGAVAARIPGGGEPLLPRARLLCRRGDHAPRHRAGAPTERRRARHRYGLLRRHHRLQHHDRARHAALRAASLRAVGADEDPARRDHPRDLGAHRLDDRCARVASRLSVPGDVAAAPARLREVTGQEHAGEDAGEEHQRKDERHTADHAKQAPGRPERRADDNR